MGHCVVASGRSPQVQMDETTTAGAAGPLLSCLNPGGCEKLPHTQTESKMRLKKKRRQDELPWGFCMRTSSGSASLSRDTGFQVAFVRVNILPGNGWPSPSGAGVLGAGSAPGRRHLPLGGGICPWAAPALPGRGTGCSAFPCHPCWSCFPSQHFTTQHSRVN